MERGGTMCCVDVVMHIIYYCAVSCFFFLAALAAVERFSTCSAAAL